MCVCEGDAGVAAGFRRVVGAFAASSTGQLRKCEAILNVGWAEFAEGPILKACKRLLVHWQAAMRLGAEVKWHAFFQKAIVALIDSSGLGTARTQHKQRE